METVTINIPDDKSNLVKMLLKELGVTIQYQSKAEKQARAEQLVNELKESVKPGPKPSMDEIVAEIREYRAGR